MLRADHFEHIRLRHNAEGGEEVLAAWLTGNGFRVREREGDTTVPRGHALQPRGEP